jgi:hypothetical protein
MRERRIAAEDLHYALCNATRCDRKTNVDEGWRVFGPDLDGDQLAIVVVFEDGMFVVTLHGD